MRIRQRSVLFTFAAFVLVLVATYSNHFNNPFHFDDFHTIVDNPAIRSLAESGRFFTDVSTFSHDRRGQSYRPLVAISAALDYAIGGGLKPFWFQLSTFTWFLVLLALMYALYMHLLEVTRPDPLNPWIASFTAAVFGLHPVCAETVNYIIQRGDVYVALGVVAGVVLYATRPGIRRYGIYLLPPLAAMFAKPTAIIFALILMAYILVVERCGLAGLLRRSAPALILCAGFSYFEKLMTPPSFFHTSLGTLDYWLTQPYVTLRYFRSFFLPLYLTADTDLSPLHSLACLPAIVGCLFCGLFVAVATWAARKQEWRAVSFGLWWFLIALIPTAIYPLEEVENDHRMFLPLIGLSLAVVCTAAMTAKRYRIGNPRAIAAVATIVLAALAWGTHQRNAVWRSEESLWRDVTEKSPNRPRAHTNLGLALSKIPGRLPEAIAEYEVALRLNPDFVNANVNLGAALTNTSGRLPEAIAHLEAALKIEPDFAAAHLDLAKALAKAPDRLPDAVREFETALRLDPSNADAHLNLGSALSRIPDRLPEAIAQFEETIRLQPDFPEAHLNLGIVLSRMPNRLPEAIAQFESALQLRPDYGDAHRNLASALLRVPNRESDAIKELEAATRNAPNTAEAHVNIAATLVDVPNSLLPAIAEYREALRIDPNYADAHTGLGIALTRQPGHLPEAIAEFQAALKLKPTAAESHSNLGLALAMAGRSPEAISEFEAAFRIRPDPAIRRTLDNMRASRGRG
jgi:tetratricopeptide (TPR) repeat protein